MSKAHTGHIHTNPPDGSIRRARPLAPASSGSPSKESTMINKILIVPYKAPSIAPASIIAIVAIVIGTGVNGKLMLAKLNTLKIALNKTV